MKNKFIATALLILILFTTGYSQKTIPNGIEDINISQINPWYASSLSVYNGVYHFGESEGESLLYFINDGNKTSVQLRWSEWKNNTWQSMCETYNNITITGNKFSAKGLSGEFKIYTNDANEKSYGIILTTSKTAMKNEFGDRTGTLAEYIEGDYPEISYRLLTKNDLSNKTKDELQLMRNEIYARYDYKFTKGGKMEKIFSKKDWYRPTYTNVESFFTNIELYNLRLIKEAEQ